MLSSLVASYNRAIWPAQLVAYGMALALLWRSLGAREHERGSARSPLAAALPGLSLAAAWAWTGAVFHARYLAAIDFMAPVYAVLFLMQALLIAWSGVRGRLALRPPASPLGWAGVALIAAAIVGDPLIAALTGASLASVPVLGLAPGPTAVLTLGALLLAEGRTPLYLVAVPVLWSLIAGATAWLLGRPSDLLLPLLGLAALLLVLVKNNRRSPAA